jgi:hypothetical protein
MKETEIAEKVVAWLEAQHWEVYQEVKFQTYGGIADIVAEQNGLLWAIECKRSLSLQVLAQAHGWHTHFRSVAIPSVKRQSWWARRTAYDVAKNYLKVGIIEIRTYGDEVNQTVAPALMREHHRFAKELRLLLVDEHRTYAKAGQQYGGYWTPYKSTIKRCRRFIAANPGCTMKELIAELGRQHYANDKSAISNLRINFQTIEKDWVFVDESERPFRLYIREPHHS